MKNSFFLLLAALIFMVSSCDNPAIKTVDENADLLKSGSKVLNFRTHLSGTNEVPANNSEASGQAIFQLSKDGEELSYKLIVDDISNVVASHIHLAPAGTNGGVVVWLYPSAPPPQLINGVFSGVLAEGTITKSDLRGALAEMELSDLIQHFYNDNAYVNVHTTLFPGGEIRGQIKGNMPASLE